MWRIIRPHPRTWPMPSPAAALALPGSHRAPLPWLPFPFSGVANCAVQLHGIALGQLHRVQVRARRPSACTAATASFFEWLETEPAPGRVLFLSMPPATVYSAFTDFQLGTCNMLIVFAVSLDAPNSV
jgi:hypothetical protein